MKERYSEMNDEKKTAEVVKKTTTKKTAAAGTKPATRGRPKGSKVLCREREPQSCAGTETTKCNRGIGGIISDTL